MLDKLGGMYYNKFIKRKGENKMLLIIMFAVLALAWVGVAIYCLLKDCYRDSFICVTIAVILIGIIDILDKLG